MSVTMQSLQQGFASNQPFDTDRVAATLSDRLQKFENTIFERSKQFVEAMNSWANQITAMNFEMDEINASFNKIKSCAGQRMMANSMITGAPPAPKDSESDIIDDSIIDIPQYPVEINMSALDMVGHQVADVMSGQPLPALITVIPKGQPMPRFWNCAQDYFAPEMSTAASASNDQFETSFSLYFNFDPVPLAVAEMRKNGK